MDKYDFGYTGSPGKYIEWLEKQVYELRKRDYWLQCLEAAGVDNWQGMEEAIEIYRTNNVFAGEE